METNELNQKDFILYNPNIFYQNLPIIVSFKFTQPKLVDK